jgi:hypothetical protein
MVIADFPNHPIPMYVSQPTYAVSPKMVKDTIYMPSSIAARVLGTGDRSTRKEEVERPAVRRAS